MWYDDNVISKSLFVNLETIQLLRPFYCLMILVGETKLKL